MRTIYLFAVCLLAVVMPSYAQNSIEDVTALSGKELQTYFSDPARKAQYISSLNEKAAQSEECQKWGVTVTDIDIEATDSAVSAVRNTANNSKGMHKASLLDAGSMASYHWTYKIMYNTVDGNNNKIIASAVIYTPQNTRAYKFGLLSCHPTVAGLQECPTGPAAPEAAIRAVADEQSIIVCPDYCGYGVSANLQHPYLIQDVTARNCIDSYLAAIAYMKATYSSTFADSFYTLFIGYSQGGSVAMACQKIYECGNVYTAAEKSLINLRHTYCGDGPYSTVATIQQYLDWANEGEDLAYPCVLPLILEAALDSYGKDCMHTVTISDYFTPEFLNCGAIAAINSKEKTMTEINDIIWKANIRSIDQILNENVIKVTTGDNGTKTLAFNTTTNEYKCLMRALNKNTVTDGWTPTHKITVFHFANDKIVPQVNSNHVKALVTAGTWSSDYVTFVDAQDAYKNQFDNYTWDAVSHYMVGNDYASWDHVSVGTLFYFWFMFGNPKDSRSE